MGLFDIFTHKTVESKYKVLLNLFKNNYPSFTIVKNEKDIVKFILGDDNKTLQYWCINQDFNASYPINETVTITMTMKIDEYCINLKKSFHQSVNQKIIYTTLAKILFEKICELGQKLEEECPTQKGTTDTNNDLENNIIKEEQALTDKQKIITLVFLCAFTNPTMEEELNYKLMLGINMFCVTHLPLKERFLYGGIVEDEVLVDMFNTMATIENTIIIRKFIDYCSNSSYFTKHISCIKNFIIILKKWGFHRSEIRVLLPYYYLRERPTHISISEGYDIFYNGSQNNQVDLLTREQKKALFAFTALLKSYKVIDNNKKEAIEIIDEFADDIYISGGDYNNILNSSFSSRNDYIDIIKTIKLDYPLNLFFSAWRELIQLEKESKVLYSRYLKTLLMLGYTSEEIYDSLNNIYIHKYQKIT